MNDLSKYYNEYDKHDSYNSNNDIELKIMNGSLNKKEDVIHEIDETDELNIDNNINLQNYYKDYSSDTYDQTINNISSSKHNDINIENDNISPNNSISDTKKTFLKNKIKIDGDEIDNINQVYNNESIQNYIDTPNQTNDTSTQTYNNTLNYIDTPNQTNDTSTQTYNIIDYDKINSIFNKYEILLTENTDKMKNVLYELINFKNNFNNVFDKIRLFKMTEFDYIINNFNKLDDELDMDIDDTSLVLENNEIWNFKPNIVKLTCDGWKGYKIKAYTKSKKIPDKIQKLNQEYKNYYIKLYNMCFETYINNFNNIELEDKIYNYMQEKFNLP